MKGPEGQPYPVNAKIPEQSDLSDKDQVLQAFRLLESPTAQAKLHELWNLTISQDEFAEKIEEFNALPAEERGKGRIETKTLENRYAREAMLAHPKGYSYAVVQGVDGTLSLKALLG